MAKFHGIKLEATGKNIVTLGDGNQINAKFNDLGAALVDLRDAITRSDISEERKLELVADIDTVQSQLAKTTPHRGIITAAWETLKGAATIDGCVAVIERLVELIGGLLG